MTQSLYHGTSFHRACLILDAKQLNGKEREGKGKTPYVSLTEDVQVGLWFGDVVLEFPGFIGNAIKIEYQNEEWKKNNPDLCEYILEGVELENLDAPGIEGMAIEKEYVIPESLSFEHKDIIIHLVNKDKETNKEYEEHLRKVFESELTFKVADLLAVS